MKRIWIVCSLLIFLIIGCRSGSDQSDILSIPKFRISFPEEGKSQISRILIFIEGHNRKLLPQEFLVKENMMEVGLDFTIPIDAEEIRVEAYDKDNQLIFDGDAEVSFTNNVPLDINLSPIMPMIKLKMISNVVSAGETFGIQVLLRYAEDVFAVAFEIEYDPEFLQVTDVVEGELWNDKILMISDHEFENRPPGKLNIGITQLESGKIKNSGEIAVVRFWAKQVGESTIRLIDNNRLRIEKANGNLIDNYESIAEFIDRAKISVDIKER